MSDEKTIKGLPEDAVEEVDSGEDAVEQEKNEEEDVSIEELLEEVKEDIASGAPTLQQEMPAEYTDLVDSEDEEDEERTQLPKAAKWTIYFSVVLAVSILLAVFAWKCVDEICALTDREKVVTITVAEEASIKDVANELKEKGVIDYRWLFKLYCWASDADEKIRPGTYELNTLFDYHAIVDSLRENSESRATVEVTIPEGYEAEDIFLLLEEKGVCSAAELKETAANYDFNYWFLEDVEVEKGDFRRLEGYLFPDTYEFYVDDTPQNAIDRFLRNFDNRFTDEMKAELENLNAQLREMKLAQGFAETEIEELTVHDIIIVASLVEKETTAASESGMIASVIYNRLCNTVYPCLRIDATIQYVLPERKEILTNADKSVRSPYNTYIYAGLPIGPIANPGISSIRAALYPADTNYLFYVINPAGGHYYAEDVYGYQAILDSLTGRTGEAEQTEEETQTDAQE